MPHCCDASLLLLPFLRLFGKILTIFICVGSRPFIFFFEQKSICGIWYKCHCCRTVAWHFVSLGRQCWIKITYFIMSKIEYIQIECWFDFNIYRRESDAGMVDNCKICYNHLIAAFILKCGLDRFHRKSIGTTYDRDYWQITDAQ